MDSSTSRKGTLLFALGLISMGSLAGMPVASNQDFEANEAIFIRPIIHQVAKVTVLSEGEVHAASSLLSVVDQEDIKPKDKLLLDKVLKWMPPLCRNSLDHLIVRYPKDSGDNSIERGQATSSTILLRGDLPEHEKIAVLIHECGHIMDLGAYRGRASAGRSVYPDGEVPTYNDDQSVSFYQISWESSLLRKQNSVKSDFVSGYAMRDPWEDLAESIAYYALQEESFRERAEENAAIAQKLAWIETHIFGPEFMTAESDEWDGKIVWDVTKIRHELSF